MIPKKKNNRGAPKGNKYALGCTTNGQPPMYSDPKELEKKINNYFLYCDENNEKLTITGLCLFCGFESRQSFYEYEKKKDFTYIIKRARMLIENMYEQRLQGNIPTGAIFALKNMGWEDRNVIAGESGSPLIVFKDFKNDRSIDKV